MTDEIRARRDGYPLHTFFRFLSPLRAQDLNIDFRYENIYNSYAPGKSEKLKSVRGEEETSKTPKAIRNCMEAMKREKIMGGT